MRTRNKWYVVFALMIGVALGVSMAPLVDSAGPKFDNGILKLTVFQVDEDDGFPVKAEIQSKDGKLVAVISTKAGDVELAIPNGEGLKKKGTFKDNPPVFVHGYRNKGNNEPHEYIGHVTVVR